MSGGSYDYLCYKDASQLIENDEELRHMSERLASLDWAVDAAAETEELLAMITGIRARVNARIKRLEPVWHEIEWWTSGDTNEAGAREMIERWREQEVPSGH